MVSIDNPAPLVFTSIDRESQTRKQAIAVGMPQPAQSEL